MIEPAMQLIPTASAKAVSQSRSVRRFLAGMAFSTCLGWVHTLAAQDFERPVTTGARAVDATPAWHGRGSQSAALYGVSVNTAGDVNGDGYDDAIVGSHLYDHELVDEGAAFV